MALDFLGLTYDPSLELDLEESLQECITMSMSGTALSPSLHHLETSSDPLPASDPVPCASPAVRPRASPLPKLNSWQTNKTRSFFYEHFKHEPRFDFDRLSSGTLSSYFITCNLEENEETRSQLRRRLRKMYYNFNYHVTAPGNSRLRPHIIKGRSDRRKIKTSSSTSTILLENNTRADSRLVPPYGQSHQIL